ncbi:MAG: NTP transferase domain-containing protein [Ilumatobacter fluminis]|uniref:UDP-N-acetylglucosamine pyrophosphorylase /glucosamine-1-phosphate N-acetyltransferase n=1 Tax=Ilumatobacter fluminis TaxID=467091 RepID=A0A4R7HYJ8_9ACTN|nr:sugar phosphate nucleotidyltransferase [Ilumatobacter fluminis]TDT15589.1 UDP-N-acetylglucosamine pyrophosphorylase /glucosamine-1-phosphate N-acetyltransferase [Ilumatobacter fluminis]
MTVSAIVLAAGAGTRMRSERPKPLHRICGRPMVLHVIHALELLKPAHTVVVVGHAADQVTDKISAESPDWANVAFAEQVEQNGTGDATAIGMAALSGDDYDDDATVIVVPGDTPLLSADTLDELVASHVANSNAATLLTSVLDDPTGYGRVIRGKDERVLRIVEQRDAAPEELDVREINTSIYAFRRDLLGPALRNLTADNAQGELYLTDVIGQLASMGHRVGALRASGAETQGVNDRWQLALAEREFRNRTNRHWLLNGVTMLDPRQTFIDVTVQLGRDVTIYPGTTLHGTTTVGDGCDIGPHTQLTDCTVGANSRVRQTVADGGVIGPASDVGPFAHITADTNLLAGTTTGPFYTAPDAR